MKNIRKIAERIEAELAANKIRKYSFRVTDKQTRELTAENGEFNLLRTLFDDSVILTVFKSGKKGVVVGNDISEKGISELVASAIASAESAIKDNCNDIAPQQDSARFRQGTLKEDFDTFFFRIKELLSDIRTEYPRIQVSTVIGEYVKVRSLLKNSNNVDFEQTYGLYGVEVQFAGHEGDVTTGLDSASVQFGSLDSKLIDLGAIRYNLDRSQRQLQQIPITGKFNGTVLLTPDCFAQFLSFVVANFTSDSVLINGTSLWKRKKGRKVASEKLTLSLDPFDKRIKAGERVTGDGYRTQKLPIIEKGILKNFTISLYAAKKTKRPVSKNSSINFVVKAGDIAYAKMIEGIERGLIVGSFSGGQPTANGEFSGVAKNAFYVENGQIKGAVSEIMINGNLASMLKDIRCISEEQVCDGAMVLPFVAVDNIVISGK